MNVQLLSRIANEARGLAMDAVHSCSSGHLGLPLGCAELGAVLFAEALRYNPNEPRWLNRDRFVLSAGHGSMFIYSWLHLAGYNVSLEQLKNFRQLHSGTPGHPESFETAGVECTTGPLGQGVANAVGLAVSGKMAAARFNTSSHIIFDHHVVCLAGDGCIQEGVSAEASAFAGHNKLDNFILIYDSNDVTLDAMAEATQSEDTARRYEAYGFDVHTVDGHDMPAFLAAFRKARDASSGRPQFIIARTEIGRGIPQVAGTQKAHGEGGAKFVEESKAALGLPAENFFVSGDTRSFFEVVKKGQIDAYDKWTKQYEAWRDANPELAALLDSGLNKEIPTDLLSQIPEFEAGKKIATRNAGSKILQPLAKAMPLLISGSADLHGSTKNYIEGGKDFSAENRDGRNILFGIREHAMASMLNGFAYDGIFRPSGATFLVFADYARPGMRLAALSSLPVLYIFTHDSVGVGEDGPTHQPVETVSSLRVIPNLDVIRPADAEETAGAFVAALNRTDGPTLLALTRQDVPALDEIPAATRREGVARGAYIARKESGELTTLLLSCGSELQHALAAARELGDGVRVVSMPCFERFERQSPEYIEEILPVSCRRRVAIEAGVSDTWYRWVGLDGRVVAIDRFGLSAPGDTVMKELGMTASDVVKAVGSL